MYRHYLPIAAFIFALLCVFGPVARADNNQCSCPADVFLVREDGAFAGPNAEGLAKHDAALLQELNQVGAKQLALEYASAIDKSNSRLVRRLQKRGLGSAALSVTAVCALGCCCVALMGAIGAGVSAAEGALVKTVYDAMNDIDIPHRAREIAAATAWGGAVSVGIGLAAIAAPLLLLLLSGATENACLITMGAGTLIAGALGSSVAGGAGGAWQAAKFLGYTDHDETKVAAAAGAIAGAIISVTPNVKMTEYNLGSILQAIVYTCGTYTLAGLAVAAYLNDHGIPINLATGAACGAVAGAVPAALSIISPEKKGNGNDGGSSSDIEMARSRVRTALSIPNVSFSQGSSSSMGSFSKLKKIADYIPGPAGTLVRSSTKIMAVWEQ